MPLQVVTGPPFSGKGRYARWSIAQREARGDLGLMLLDWTALYLALVPGEQSALRDDEVSETGSPRLVGLAYTFLVGQAIRRELDGYVTVNAPRRALEIADQGGLDILEMQVSTADLASRTNRHMARLSRTVDRATRAGMVGSCTDAVATYLRDESLLEGRARTVRQSGRGFRVGDAKRPFDRALWERGLTENGRAALAALQAEGNPEPTPSQVMRRLLRGRS